MSWRRPIRLCSRSAIAAKAPAGASVPLDMFPPNLIITVPNGQTLSRPEALSREHELSPTFLRRPERSAPAGLNLIWLGDDAQKVERLPASPSANGRAPDRLPVGIVETGQQRFHPADNSGRACVPVPDGAGSQIAGATSLGHHFCSPSGALPGRVNRCAPGFSQGVTSPDPFLKPKTGGVKSVEHRSIARLSAAEIRNGLDRGPEGLSPLRGRRRSAAFQTPRGPQQTH